MVLILTSKLSSNVVGHSNDENNFPHKSLLTNTEVWRLRKAFANGSSANIKLSKTQLLKTGLPLLKNVLKPLAKSVLIPLGLTASASAIDAAIHKKIFGSGNTKLIISNEEMNDIMKIIKSLEESGLLIKGVSEKNKNEVKEQKRGFLSMLLGTIGAILLGNLLAGKGTIRADKGTIR